MRLTKAKFDELTLIGSQMANICFNLGQHHHLGEPRQVFAREMELMYVLDRQWREKLMEIRGATPAAVRKRKH